MNTFKKTHGVLLLRVSVPLIMALNHGLPKLMSYSKKAAYFPDPLHISSPLSLALVIFAECVCALCVSAGLFTRLACIPLIVTMFVAAFVFHAGDPFAKKEMAILFLLVFTALFFTGSGPWALGNKITFKKEGLLGWLLEKNAK